MDMYSSYRPEEEATIDFNPFQQLSNFYLNIEGRNQAGALVQPEPMGVEITDVTEEERQNWSLVTSAIPDKVVVEVLLEYLIQECEWLWQCPDIIDLWTTAISRQAVSSSVAGLLCMSIAFPALFMSDRTTMYRPSIDFPNTTSTLLAFAKQFVTGCHNLRELELLGSLTVYTVYSGDPGAIFHYNETAASVALACGFLDEQNPQWLSLSATEKARARGAVANLINHCRWQLFGRNFAPFDTTSVNVQLPETRAQSISSLIDLQLPGTTELPFRVLRFKANAEKKFSNLYRNIFLRYTEFMPPARELLNQIQSAIPQSALQLELLSMRSEALHRNLITWIDIQLPALGFGIVSPEMVDLKSPPSCIRAAQSLTLHDAFSCSALWLLRPWLCLETITSSRQQYLQAECLATAERAMVAIPHLKALLASGNTPVVSTFTVANLFSAATCFAIPVLRAVQSRTNKSHNAEIKDLPAFPDAPLPGRGGKSIDPTISQIMPNMLLTDKSVKHYACNILVILQALSTLKGAQNGEFIENRLRTLMGQYGLHDRKSTSGPPGERSSNSNSASPAGGQPATASGSGDGDWADAMFGFGFASGNAQTGTGIHNTSASAARPGGGPGAIPPQGPIAPQSIGQPEPAAENQQLLWDDLFNLAPNVWDNLLPTTTAQG